MAGSPERLIYDPTAYFEEVRRSTGPFAYQIDPVGVNHDAPCRMAEPGWIGRVGVSMPGNRPLIDVESDLFQLNTLNTKDPNAKYKPMCPKCRRICTDGYPCGGGVGSGCEFCQVQAFNLPTCQFGNDYTRNSNPICTARGLGFNRFQPLNLNPQDEDRWLPPSNTNICYRNVVKDNHVPCIPQFIDPRAALPPPAPRHVPCGSIIKVCAPFTGSLNKLSVSHNWNNIPYV